MTKLLQILPLAVSLGVSALADLAKPVPGDSFSVPTSVQDVSLVFTVSMLESAPGQEVILWKDDSDPAIGPNVCSALTWHDYWSASEAENDEYDWWFYIETVSSETLSTALSEKGYTLPSTVTRTPSGTQQPVSEWAFMIIKQAPDGFVLKTPTYPNGVYEPLDYWVFLMGKGDFNTWSLACWWDTSSSVPGNDYPASFPFSTQGSKLVIPSPPPSGSYFAWLYNMGEWLADNVYDFTQILSFETGDYTLLYLFGGAFAANMPFGPSR